MLYVHKFEFYTKPKDYVYPIIYPLNFGYDLQLCSGVGMLTLVE